MSTTPEIEKAIELLFKGLSRFVGRTDQDAVWELRMIKDRIDDMVDETIRAVEEDTPKSNDADKT